MQVTLFPIMYYLLTVTSSVLLLSIYPRTSKHFLKIETVYHHLLVLARYNPTLLSMIIFIYQPGPPMSWHSIEHGVINIKNIIFAKSKL